MVVADHNKNIQRIIDVIKGDVAVFDNGETEGLLRSVIFGDPDNNDKNSIKQKPAVYVTTNDSIQSTRYNFGYSIPNNRNQVTVQYNIVLLAVSKAKTESSQKQLYSLMKNLELLFEGNPTFTDPANPGTDPVFSRSVVNLVPWDKENKGQLITSITYVLTATIGVAYLANFPGIGDVILLSKPNAPEGIIFTDDLEQKPIPNRVLTENGDFGSIDVEYESTVALDDSFRAKFAVEEDITITTASGAKVYHIKYISINPTAQFDSIERTILHMEIIPI